MMTVADLFTAPTVTDRAIATYTAMYDRLLNDQAMAVLSGHYGKLHEYTNYAMAMLRAIEGEHKNPDSPDIGYRECCPDCWRYLHRGKA